MIHRLTTSTTALLRYLTARKTFRAETVRETDRLNCELCTTDAAIARLLDHSLIDSNLGIK